MGGGPAQVGTVLVSQPGESAPKRYQKVTALPIRKGATIELLSAGGGGLGPAYERPIEKVVTDVRCGYVTVAGARRDYGVVLREDDLSVDEEATKRLRAKIQADAPPPLTRMILLPEMFPERSGGG